MPDFPRNFETAPTNGMYKALTKQRLPESGNTDSGPRVSSHQRVEKFRDAYKREGEVQMVYQTDSTAS